MPKPKFEPFEGLKNKLQSMEIKDDNINQYIKDAETIHDMLYAHTIDTYGKAEGELIFQNIKDKDIGLFDRFPLMGANVDELKAELDALKEAITKSKIKTNNGEFEPTSAVLNKDVSAMYTRIFWNTMMPRQPNPKIIEKILGALPGRKFRSYEERKGGK